jgi:carboxylesterase type B
MKRIAMIVATATILAVAAPLARAALDEPIRVEGGLVTGTPAWGWGVRLFRGIPYAAPPIGPLRYAGIAPGYREAHSGYTNDARYLDVARVLLRGTQTMLARQIGKT